jgi:hypothetical protein
MTPKIQDPFDRGYHDSPVNDLIVLARHLADRGESHVAFQGTLPEWVTPPPKLREMADALGVARDAAFGHDDVRLAEQKTLMEALIKAVDQNSYQIIMLSNHRNDPAILLNGGYELKPVKLGRKAKLNLLDMIPELRMEHLVGVTGGVLAVLKRATKNAICELQMTETPDDESSWRKFGEGIFNSSRCELRGNKPTAKLYFRTRYHDGGLAGAWSQPVSIIIL